MVHQRKKILITGAAGFIGAAVSKKFLNNGYQVYGLDNLNSYYDPNLKRSRLGKIEKNKNSDNWIFEVGCLEDIENLNSIFLNFQPHLVLNLAAQAGVRYSLENPKAYINSNVLGFFNILECCKNFKIEHLIYASSSSVYGGNREFPFSETHKVDKPISLYAASKVTNELMANVYSHLHNISCTGLRFFTVYGPWGRPDMAPMKFAKSIFEDKPIDIYNYGKMIRDFTYIDDIVEGIFRCSLKSPSNPKDVNDINSIFSSPHKIFNIGNSEPIELVKFIEILEENIGIKAIKNYMEIQPGDVIKTFADSSKLKEWIDYSPSTSIEKGVELFVRWFKDYYKY